MSAADENQLLLEMAEATSGITGAALFREIAVQLAKALRMDYAFVGEMVVPQQTIHTLAFCADGNIVDNLTYTLPGTPCENVIRQRRFCAYPDRLQPQFPEDRVLAEMGIESYFGTPLLDSTGRAIGLLSLMSRSPAGDYRQAEGLLRLCAARAAAELDRLRSEQVLRESEESFRATFNQTAVGIAHVAPDGKFLRINQKFCDIAGYSQEEMLRRTFQDITHPDDLNADLKSVQQVLAGEIETYSMEKRYFRKNGTTVWVNLTVSLARNEQGEPKYFISVVEDITGRKLAEEEMRKLTSTVEQTADSVAITDRDGIVQYVNPAFEMITGYTREETVGMKASILKSGKHDATFYKQLWDTISHGEVFRERFTNRRKNGALYYEEKTITPLKNEKGDVTHFVSTGKDITARVLAENENRRMQTFLNSVVENLPDMLFVKDAEDLRFVRFNKAAEELLGYSRAEMLGKNDYDFFPPGRGGLFHRQGQGRPEQGRSARHSRRAGSHQTQGRAPPAYPENPDHG